MSEPPNKNNSSQGFDKLNIAPRAMLFVFTAVVTYFGWRELFFLTDDSFIAFRYIANSLAGYGLVWNPPPFRPVEGYTSFLWVIILEAIWRITGVEPPQAANWVALAFGYGTLFLGYRLVERMTLHSGLNRHRLALTGMVLCGTLTNRTFLTWLSSGLETAMFNFFMTWWIARALTPYSARRTWTLKLTAAASLTALTRPDGLLIMLATLILLAGHWRFRLKRTNWSWREGVWSWPLLAVPLHLVWRKYFYGAWLPNTFYAKNLPPWPTAGLRYDWCFIWENGIEIWFLFILAWLFKIRRYDRHKVLELAVQQWPHFLVLGAVLIYLSYYTFIVGGDHFEYRVYSFLIPLLYVSAVWLINQTTYKAWAACGMMLAFILASYPIAWMQYYATKKVTDLTAPIAQNFPQPLRPLIAQYDEYQSWLTNRFICFRHHKHKVFYEQQMSEYRSDLPRPTTAWRKTRKVMAVPGVGIIGWLNLDTAIIDTLGLNDRVIAHHPFLNDALKMAHRRLPPDGYLECFLNDATGAPRQTSITDDEIRQCETHKWY